MSANINISITNADIYKDLYKDSLVSSDYIKSDKANAKEVKNIFAGNLKIADGTDALIERKRGFAQKQAMKLIGDAWERDTKTAEGIDEMEKSKSDKVKEVQDLRAKLNDIEKDKEAIRKECGIAPDSQEQKDLELLEKYQNYKGGAFDEEFSEEDIKRLEELQNMPRTEYQNKVLAQNAAAGGIKYEIYKKELEVIAINESVTDAHLETLKSQDMLKADDAADSIIAAAEDEIKGILIKDGLDKIEDQQEEEQEKAEEIKEEKEELQKVDEEKKNREEQEEILENEAKSEKMDKNVSMQVKTETSVEAAQKNIQKLLEENNLINEDLKGIEIDFNF